MNKIVYSTSTLPVQKSHDKKAAAAASKMQQALVNSKLREALRAW